MRRPKNSGIPGTCLREAYRQKSINVAKKKAMDSRMPPVSQEEAESYALLMENGSDFDMTHMEEDYDMKVFQRVYKDTGNAVIAMQCANKRLAQIEYGHPTDDPDDDEYADIDLRIAALEEEDEEEEEEEQDPVPTHFSRKTKKPPYQRLTALRMKIEKLTSDRDV